MPRSICARGAAVLLLLSATTAARAATVTSIPVTNGGPHAIAPAADGSQVFVGARDCAYVGALALPARTLGMPVPPSGAIPCVADEGVFTMIDGPDGRIWFTLYGTNKVGRVNRDGTGFQTLTVASRPLGLTTGPDGNVWFTVNGPPGQVGRINPATFALVEPAVNVPGNVQGPRGIVAAPDGALYVAGGEAGKIWKVTTASPPVITEVQTALNGPSFGQVGPDGRVWFTLFEGDGLRAYTPGTNTGQTIPLQGPPWDIAFGEDGKAYVTMLNGNRLTQLVPSTGATTPIMLAGADSQPAFIDAAPNGNLFAATRGANAVLEIVPDVPPRVTTGAVLAVGTSTAAIAGTVDARTHATTARVAFGAGGALDRFAAGPAVAATDGAQTLGFQLSALAPGTTYSYRVEATNPFGTTPGPVRTFTTAPAPALAPTRPPLVQGQVTARWTVKRGRTYVKALNVTGLKSAATIQLRCSGKGCAFKTKTRTVKKATKSVRLASYFKRRGLRSRAVVEVRLSARASTTRVVRFTVRGKGRKPLAKKLCLPAGTAKPITC